MEYLTDELLRMVLEWLPPTDLLLATVHVSKRFSSLIQNDKFWRRHPLLPGPTGSKNASLTTHQLQRLTMYAASVDTERPPRCLEHDSLLVAKFEAVNIRDSGRRVCAASTTDHIQEGLENTLTRIRVAGAGNFWWSSRSSMTRNSNELLLFATNCPTAVISQVKVKPLKDPHPSSPQNFVYTWKETTIRAFYLPLDLLADPDGNPTKAGFPCSFSSAVPLPPDDERQAPSDQATIDALLQGAKPVYESDRYSVPADSNATLTFDLPPGIIGNVVTIELIGKNREERRGFGYYACVERVECLGIPLYTHAKQPIEVAAVDTPPDGLHL